MCTSGRGDLRHRPKTREQKNTLFFSSELHYAEKVNLLCSRKVLSLDSRSKLLSMLARQPGFRFLVENFSQQIFFRRKEKKNVTLLLWYRGKCWRRCGEIAAGGVVVVVEAPRRKRSARSTSSDDDNSRRWAFRPGKAHTTVRRLLRRLLVLLLLALIDHPHSNSFYHPSARRATIRRQKFTTRL